MTWRTRMTRSRISASKQERLPPGIVRYQHRFLWLSRMDSGFTRKSSDESFGLACLYGRVIKTRRNDRIVKVERRAVLGDRWRLEQALHDSEDSMKLNTSFVERLNLTIRQGSAYLGRRTISHARWKKQLEDHLELF